MKKSFLFLAALALVGAGCTSTATVDTKTQADVNTDKSADTTQVQGTQEGSATNDSTQTTADGLTVIKTGGVEATIKTDTKAETKTDSTTKQDDVPVTDIVLGNADVKINMEVGNYFFSPKTVTASSGQKINITFTKNTGMHNFIIDKIGLNYTIKQGEGVVFTAPKEPGSYPFYCGIGSHRAMGMEGTLIVK